jgi:hypothetical protein
MVDLGRLSTALHFAVPPAIFTVLVHAAVANKVMGMNRLLGEIASPRVRTLSRRVYVVCNIVGVGMLLVLASYQCAAVLSDPRTPVVRDEACFPTVSLLAVVLLLLLWVDRITLNFLHAPNASSTFVARLAHGATVAGLFMALAVSDDVLVLPLLLLAIANRSSASLRWAGSLASLSQAVRVSVVVAGVVELCGGGASRRSAALCISCGLLTR